jgi:CarboxypepD_reg-like domain
MRNKILFLTCIFLCIVSIINAQYHQLTGVVTTAKDHRPIAYAHVGIPARGMGVVSNEVGAFTLNYPAAYAKDSLKVSCLGFKTYSVALSKVQQEDTLRIYLKPEVLELAEAMVKPHSDSGRAILREALKRLKKNYPSKMHQLNAFYREKAQSRDDYGYTRLMEGMVDIQDWGIDANPDRMRIRLNEYRKSNDLAKQSLGQRALGLMFGKKNNLYLILTQDPVRIHKHNVRTVNEHGDGYIHNSRRYWLGEILKSPRSSVRLVDMTSYDGEWVYHIKFRFPGHFGSLYINSEDYGIHHIDFYETVDYQEIFSDLKIDTNTVSERRQAYIKDVKNHIESTFHEGKFANKLNVTYQKIGGKYYLSYMEWMTMGSLRKSKVEEGKTTFSYNFCSLMVNEVQPDKKEMEKVKLRETLSRREDTNDLRKQYNERFWRNYNVLLATPLENKVIRDLTFEESLEQQFKKNQ